MSVEAWVPVCGYEGLYEVSNLGAVRSVDRHVEFKDGRKPRLFPSVPLRARTDDRGYCRVTLSKNSVCIKWCIHRLVCEAFNGPKPHENAVIRHLNGNPSDNRPENLKWGTAAENTADMIRHGNAYWSNQTHCAHGHEFTESNTRLSKGRQQRNCRACERIRAVPKNKRRAEARRASRPVLTCRVCSAQFQGYPHSAFCGDDCRKAARRVSFKARGRAA